MKRSIFIKSVIGLYGVTKMPIDIIKQWSKIYLLECFVSGLKYYDGYEFIDSINQSGGLIGGIFGRNIKLAKYSRPDTNYIQRVEIDYC